MDRNYIDTHHIIERYLADQLPPAQQAAFEAYYLAHPEMLDEMETVAALKVGFGALPAAPAAPRRYARFVPAAIAALLLAAVAGWLLDQRTLETSTPLMSSPIMAARTEQLRTALPAGQSVRIEHRRSVGSDAAIQLPAQPRALRLRVQPDATLDAPSYRLTLLRVAASTGPQTVASLTTLLTDTDGLVVVFLDSATLQAGNYELRLANAADATSEADYFSIAVSAAAP